MLTQLNLNSGQKKRNPILQTSEISYNSSWNDVSLYVDILSIIIVTKSRFIDALFSFKRYIKKMEM